MTDSFTTDGRGDHANPIRVLLVEDHDPLARAIRQGLEEEGYAVHVFVEGRVPDAVDGYAAVIIDLLRREEAGLKLLRTWRSQPACPRVLVLSKPGHLVAEADTCLPIPFAFDDLLAWLRSVIPQPGEINGASAKFTYT